MDNPHLTIVKFEEQMTLKIVDEGVTKWVGVMSADLFEVLKKGLHAEHEIDITRMILASAFPGDDEDDNDGLPRCMTHDDPYCEVC